MYKDKKIHSHSIRVRYAETDQMGVVHHGNYPTFLEEARTAWLREMGISYKKMEASGIGLPITSVSVKYKKSALYDDVLTIKTILSKIPNVRLEFDYEIYNEAEELLVTAKTELVFINMQTKRPMKAPDYFLEVLENWKNKEF
ncbi:acyl-CoA thioesterase [Aurantibacter aestuarii]|uniref:Thioesterase n=1 Tax=Aurantibacter aestuarii TaxID=1266046 RepID=A0A2T1N850_9FLAO|nr:thioesterase family protein [Aurantibacter aestuarii]PSG88041.1 thioesterase [Aurantibacter aestuarii]